MKPSHISTPHCTIAVTPAVGPTLLEAEREHEQDHAQLGQRVHDGRVGDQRHRHVRPDDQPGDDVAEHHRLAQVVAQHRHHRGDGEDDGEGFQEVIGAMHGPLLGGLARCGGAGRELLAAGRRVHGGDEGVA
jgi:hypothetical protein